MGIELIDTHAHLDEDSFSADVSEVVSRAESAGVRGIVTIGTTLESCRQAIALAERFPILHAAIGIQPNYVSAAKPGDWDAICELANAAESRVVAIGETGLDRYWDHSPIDLQVDYFRKHLELSRLLGLPFIVHCRDADADVVAELRRAAESSGTLNGIMHSFCGDAETARICVDLGMHISFSGMVTYKKNTELRETAAGVPVERLLLETDSPYLSPVPYRGKRNEPSFVQHTGEVLAETFSLPFETLATETTANARRLFGI